MNTYLYVHPGLRSVSLFQDAALPAMTERHHFRLPVLSLKETGDLAGEIDTASATGVVFGVEKGLPDRSQLRLAGHALRRGRAVYFYWPLENAAEVVDAERLSSFWRHWAAYVAVNRALAVKSRLRNINSRLGGAKNRLQRLKAGLTAASRQASLEASMNHLRSTSASTYQELSSELNADAVKLAGARSRLLSLTAGLRAAEARLDQIGDGRAAAEHIAAVQKILRDLRNDADAGEATVAQASVSLYGLSQRVRSASADAGLGASGQNAAAIKQYQDALSSFARALAPVPFRNLSTQPRPDARLKGTGIYVRTDYWAQLVSGGSYGHTCYVAKELARVTEDFTCLMASRYPLLDDLGLKQEVIRPQAAGQTEIDLLRADAFYYDALKPRLEAIRPAYLYERLVIGNFAAARLSRDLQIPYIVEYNGSELAMSRSFGGSAREHEALLLDAERLAFEQATVITVVSDHVRDDVLSRGVDPAKVVVNPNGVDCAEYAPATPEERRAIRASLSLSDDACVVAFIGTFGGWHGIDVLAAALPRICAEAPEARFLLIGDGNLKPQVLDAVRQHGLQDRIVDVGRTEQRAGARLLKAADIYVSPHSSHMGDLPFFGSPTKLFEYMALGGGIVASDLEQLGEVLSPALRPADFAGGRPVVDGQRAVLCRPGDVDEFVAGVVALVRNPEVAAALGRNARAATEAEFSWERHVERIWKHALGLGQDLSWRKAS
jgi:glycosyltransferase involved in cell wall biosynthesis